MEKCGNLVFQPLCWLSDCRVFQINSIRMAINYALNTEDTVADWGSDMLLRIQSQASARILE